MSEKLSGEACMGEREEADIALSFKESSFRDFGSMSSQDSGYSELLKSYSFENADKDVWGKKEGKPTSDDEHPTTPLLGFPSPLRSLTHKKRFLSHQKAKDDALELCETPKVGGKKFLPRRKLHIPYARLQEVTESQNGSLENQISHLLSLEANASSSAARKQYLSPLVFSTRKPEAEAEKLRLIFAQQKTSTVDESKESSCGLFEVDCLSPIPGNSSQDSFRHEFSDSSLCVNDDKMHAGPLGASLCRTADGSDEDVFMTPISNLGASMNFNARQRFSLSTQTRGSISTPKDSGFDSLSWDRAEESLSDQDQESSFQELLEKPKGPLRVGDTVKGSRQLVRLRRLSTLREQGSQSETEEERPAQKVSSEVTPDSPETQRQGRAEARSALADLSSTPALQLVHELFLTNKRKRFQQEFLEERDGGRIAVLQCVLAGLIGKKMGLKQLDILTELKQRNLKHVLAMILDCLMAESLCSVWKVSRNWQDIIIQDKKANQRRKSYMAQLKMDSEGMAVLHVQDAGTRLHLLNRSALRLVQAQARTPASQKYQVPIVSPWGEASWTPGTSCGAPHFSRKQEEYVKVAQTLFSDEALKPCPKCQSPAKYQPHQKRGWCSRAACGFDFCVLCLCHYHGAEECRTVAKSRHRKDALPGSTRSKQNLKRL
ncbi:F-box only protein 43 [Suncus etruscus]|uniref:F-box only protein 43 n=1 Tax=Suncus etruscus TaxID=109475 RepID=UPI002110D983|nr:F-box only protein 43 [Suncus etruscus]